jgi:catechol 2,3-dioxygenase-like lactoylglutathione lyase family enzyme
MNMRPHLSINVRNLEDSVRFYEKVFGQGPQKKAGGYAKFDLLTPAFNFSMHEVAEGRVASRVNHLGIEVTAADDVDVWKERLNNVGISTISEEDTECCYARQDKVWFQDPDGNYWEVFFVHEQLSTTGAEPPVKPKKLDKGQLSVCGPGSRCC